MYTVRIILDTIDAIQQEEFKKLLEFIVPFITDIVVYDSRHIYSEFVLKNKKIYYNRKPEIADKDIDCIIYSTPLLLGVDGAVFIQLLPKVLKKMKKIQVYEYMHNRIKINRKIKKDDLIST